MKYKLIQNADKIFSLEFENSYDLAMCFLRVQEFYESSNKHFRGNTFHILEYMDWYSKEHSFEGCFTYPKDWAGFNISSEQIERCYNETFREHLTPYDTFMEWEIYNYIFKEIVDQDKSYLIGYVKNKRDNSVFEHEIAHALFFLDNNYKKNMTKNVGLWSPNFKKDVFNLLKQTGYDKSVFIDEFQAYFSTDESFIRENIIIDEKVDSLKNIFDTIEVPMLMKDTFQKFKEQILYKKPKILKSEDFNIFQ